MPTYLSPGVYVEEVEAGSRPIEGVGTSVAAFVGMAARGPFNQPTLVSNWTQFTEAFGDFVPGSYLAHAVYGYFLNGGSTAYVVRIGQEQTADADEVRGRAAPKALPAGAQAVVGAYRVQAAERAPKTKQLSVEIADAGGENPPDDQFKLVVRVDGKEAETFDNVTTKRGDDNVATKVNQHSKLVVIEELASGSALTRPDKGTAELQVPEPEPEPPATGDLGADDYIGDAADRTGFSGLEAVDEVTIVAVPDLVAALEQGAIDLETFQAVQLAMIAHCELMGNRMAILDPPPGLNPQQVKDWRVDTAGYDSKYATLYWPYLKVFDPATGGNRFVPPSGHVAGIWARNDESRGVHKAPANEVVRGVITLATQITRAEHNLLNPVGINAIRTFPGRGVRVWGARTLSSDPAWRYVNVRRLFNYLEESILIGTQWVVFEPNDDALWARIRRTISAFLVNEWRKGALFGLSPEEAFFVQCDRETNPAEAIDAGQVTCRIGVAPVKPAEFVIFQLSQFSGGTSLAAE
ncbi:tail sheath protein [Cellulomonas flavigena DSM 20109]|uniref:Tail sheath protein n=1 Tax=Cellulomonas flavigena (strain ATCC 482 / DSM 20109 / BCRC 11376 / JCM 18109 / NBRC 3775 / NCIMB 8073 / NRS 134) TaxID=446466 RepID=D5UGQ3_CELFN|nr:phage tail sheath subtilisin-like domain-containing protein [Cellulomonas flavigena]ADG75151.1 tail sheath protein [Cellulomonas flavigena DSM 20109]